MAHQFDISNTSVLIISLMLSIMQGSNRCLFWYMMYAKIKLMTFHIWAYTLFTWPLIGCIMTGVE